MDCNYGAIDPEVAASWLASLDVSARTKRAYDVGFRAWCGFVASCSYDFDDLEEHHVLDFKDHLANGLGLSPSTVSLYISAVRSFYRFSEPRGVPDIARNVKGSKSPRGFKKESLSAEQARRLLELDLGEGEAPLRDHAILSLMLHTGLRDIEVVRADVGDLTTAGGFRVLRVRGKGRAEADELVKVSAALDGDIASYLGARRTGGAAAAMPPSAPLFASCSPRNRGGRLTTRSVSRIVKDCLRRIGIDDPRFTAHSLRHTAITLSLVAGADLEDARAMARHADISTTMVYSHHVDRLANAAEDKLSEILDA